MPTTSPENALWDLIKAVDDGKNAAQKIIQIPSNRLIQTTAQTNLTKRTADTIAELDKIAAIVAAQLAKPQRERRPTNSPIPESMIIQAIQRATRTADSLKHVIGELDDSLANIDKAAQKIFGANIHSMGALLAAGINGYSGTEIQLRVRATAVALKQAQFHLSPAASQKPHAASEVQLTRGQAEIRDRYSVPRQVSDGHTYTKNTASAHKNLIEALSVAPLITAANKKLKKAAIAIAGYIKNVATSAMMISAPYNELRLTISERPESQGAYILSTNIRDFVVYFGPYLTIFTRKIAAALGVRENAVQLELREMK